MSPKPRRRRALSRRTIMLRSRAITQRCTANMHSSVVPGISDWPSVPFSRNRPTQAGDSAESPWGNRDLLGGRCHVSVAYAAQVTSWMRRRDHNIFANATSLLICGLLAGVVVAAAAFPAAAMSGLAAKAGGETFAQLPSELKHTTAPQVSRIFASDGKTPVSVFYDEFRSDVPLKDINKNMQNAIVAAEDHQFFEHNGVDLKGVARAIVSNKSGKSQQGASTLTMQYVRMSLAYSATNPQEVVDATKDTPKRKITEMKYALQIEKELSKQQILERSLNTAPFGGGAYGIFAASQVYFSKKPKDLTVGEAALLARMVKAPTAFDPTTETGYPQAKTGRTWVLGN